MITVSLIQSVLITTIESADGNLIHDGPITGIAISENENCVTSAGGVFGRNRAKYS